MTAEPSVDPATAETLASVLIVDGDIVSRHVIADYLRHCGYAVVEAANTEEALTALTEPTLSIDVILCHITALASRNCRDLAAWVRSNRPELEVRFAGGDEMAAEAAAELCESGPHLKRPYEPLQVIEYIKRLRESRLG